ncbi:hypothetical protein HY634_00740 [Candidatus Uhrbacteria bacterium]|nr:hypothetical protein [Candidatus Uhrbacteria bacterium]
MSDYRKTQLVTYVGGPFIALIGVILPILPLVPSHAGDGRYVAIAASVPFAMVFIVSGIYVLREGRRQLASDHWRAEHDVP